MSERKPQALKRERIRLGINHRPEPREQTVYRDGKKVTLVPLLCRLHSEPWQTCTKSSTAKL